MSGGWRKGAPDLLASQSFLPRIELPQHVAGENEKTNKQKKWSVLSEANYDQRLSLFLLIIYLT